jgi:beta-galactosidase
MWPFRPLDYRKWAEHVDFIALDSYPDPHGPAAEEAAFAHDVMRSLRPGRPFVLMEQATTQVNWRAVNGLKRPGQMRALSLQAVARGADGVMFFQWRQSRGGDEKFHSAMVPHGGAQAGSRVWREVVGLGSDLVRLAPVGGTKVAARVAIAMDWENWWALEQPSRPVRLDYPAWLADFHRLCFRRNVAVDFVHPGQDLSAYSVVFAPVLQLLRDTDARNLTQWVDAGGRLVVGPFSGIVDANDRVVLGGYPALLRATLGLVVEEWDGLAPGTTRRVRLPGGRTTRGSVLAEVVHLEGAKAVATFAEDFYAGKPAATRHRRGRGEAWYLATRFDDAALDRLLGSLLPAGPAAPAGVEVSVRRDKDRTFVFLLNHTRSAVAVPPPPEAVGGRDLLTGKKVARRLRLEPFGVAVVAAAG